MFVGWTQTPDYENATKAPTFVKSGDRLASSTCYAVYASREIIPAGAFDGVHGGTYKIYAQVEDQQYFATSELDRGKLLSTTVEEQASDFTFEPVDGGFAIKIGDKYLKHPYGSGSASNIGTQSTPFCWTVEAGTHGTWRVNSTSTQETGRALIFRAGSYNTFAAYAASNVKAGTTSYYDLEIATLGGEIFSGYSTSCEYTPQGVENVVVEQAAIKALRDGQLVIIRGDAVYSITGIRIK